MQREIFTEDHNIFREQYRKFLQKEVELYRESWRDAGIVPREMFQKMGEQGYLLTWADEAFGGLGIEDFRYQQIMIEEDATYGEVGFYHSLHSRLVAPYFKHFGNDEQCKRFLPKCVSGDSILAVAMTEPDAGSDFAGMKSRAEDKGDYWLLNGSELGVDSDRVAISGQSAGACLAAATTLRARDQSGPQVCFQLLEIPVFDDRMNTPSMLEFKETPLWNHSNAMWGWKHYLGSSHSDEVSPYAAPSRAEDLTRLPPTYISTMEFDPLRDEGIEFALRLMRAGISVELHSFPGTFHGSSIFMAADVSRRNHAELIAVLKRHLHG